MMKMLLKNNSEKVKILVRYFETLTTENKLKWCQNRYMDTFYERVYNRLCTLIRKECVEDG